MHVCVIMLMFTFMLYVDAVNVAAPLCLRIDVLCLNVCFMVVFMCTFDVC